MYNNMELVLKAFIYKYFVFHFSVHLSSYLTKTKENVEKYNITFVCSEIQKKIPSKLKKFLCILEVNG